MPTLSQNITNTINFGQAGITSTYLFNATVSNTNLSTSTLEAFVMTETGSIELV